MVISVFSLYPFYFTLPRIVQFKEVSTTPRTISYYYLAAWVPFSVWPVFISKPGHCSFETLSEIKRDFEIRTFLLTLVSACRGEEICDWVHILTLVNMRNLKKFL